jgi:acyl carrier protein
MVHERLEEVLRTFFNDDEIVLTEDLTPAEVPGWDSLAHVNLMCSIEEAFGVQFSANELADFSTVGQLERTLERKLAARG